MEGRREQSTGNVVIVEDTELGGGREWRERTRARHENVVIVEDTETVHGRKGGEEGKANKECLGLTRIRVGTKDELKVRQ